MASFSVGITRDTLRPDGTSIFDRRALRLFDEAGLSWEFIADDVRELTAAHAAKYDALCVLNPKVTAATLATPDGSHVDAADRPRLTAGVAEAMRLRLRVQPP